MSETITKDQALIDKACVNTIRTLAMDAIQKANSGHPGAPMGLAAAGYVLWTRILKHNPKDTAWQDRDRFVLSGGHASMLLYSLLYLTGYDLSLEDIQNFRQWGSKTPGHPEYGHTPGVETTTGPLGQGFAMAVGLAMAERMQAAAFNRPEAEIVNHYTYVMCGDGDLMEGISSEAASLAGHLGLGKLICIYDDNQISIEGPTSIAFTEDTAKRFEAQGWQVIPVADGNDLSAIESALKTAQADTGKPSLIKLRTHIAYGSPNKQDSSDAHGAPLGDEEIRLTKQNLECSLDDPFCVPKDVLTQYRQCIDKGQAAQTAWQQAVDEYAGKYPELYQKWCRALAGEPETGWDAGIPDFKAEGKALATRAASGKTLNAIAPKVPFLIGGSADLAPSNNTVIKGESDFQKDHYQGRNIRFGVREHAMGAILSGMALHKGIRPYGGTFLVFADYMRPAIRLAAMMKLPVIYVFTHDSIAVGEDGPTHQPVEHLAALRAIPGLTVLRPADPAETALAWKYAINHPDGPIALILSRQGLPLIDMPLNQMESGFEKGAYPVADCQGQPDILLLATGSEVAVTIEAARQLAEKGVAARVVSMPSWELFEKASADYKEAVLPASVTRRIAVEAGIAMGWERYTGSGGTLVAMSSYGASAPGGLNMQKFGFTPENVLQTALGLLQS